MLALRWDLQLRTRNLLATEPTCSTNGAHFGSGPIRPAAPTIAAALHFGHKLRVLIGAAPVQQASVAVPTARIWEIPRNNTAWRWNSITHSYEIRCDVCMLSILARTQSQRSHPCFTFSLIWKIATTYKSHHFRLMGAFLTSCNFWHCAPAWLTIRFLTNINISSSVSHPVHPACLHGENGGLNYWLLG